MSDPVYVAPVGSAVDVFYPVTIDQVRLLAEANDLEIRTSAASPRNYILWATSGGVFAGLRAFVARAHQ